MKIYHNLSDSVEFILQGARKRRLAAFESAEEVNKDAHLYEHTNLLSINKKVSL